MSHRELAETKRYETLIFDYGTTTRSDYRDGEITKITKTKYKERPEKERGCYTPLKDVHTLSNWKRHVPFDALLRPKGIIDTNPCEIQAPFTKPIDENREMAQKTRPRLVMSPAVSIDEIPEPARSILVKDMYVSDMSRHMEEAVSDIKTFNVTSPLPGLPSPANPLALPKVRVPKVPPAWRKDCVSWDSVQLRCYCDHQKEFWSRHPVSRCPACDQTALAKVQGQEDINRLVQMGK